MSPLRRFAPALLALLLLVWSAGAPVAADAPTRQPYVGVTITERVLTAPRPARLHVVQIDLRAKGIRVAVTAPGGSREVVRESTLDFLTRTGAQIAVNGHFFLPFPSDDADAFVIGLAVDQGRVYSAFEHPAQDFAIAPDAPALVFDAKAHARIAHRRRAGDDGTRVKERGRAWTAVAGSAQVITDGRVSIPDYRDDAHPRGVLTPGGPDASPYSNTRSWYDLITSRTIAGLSRNRRTLTLVASEGRAGTSGLTVRELAELLRRDFGVWNAINLDGGGSTSLAWVDPATGQATLLNASTDGPAGRRVATSLAIFAARRAP